MTSLKSLRLVWGEKGGKGGGRLRRKRMLMHQGLLLGGLGGWYMDNLDAKIQSTLCLPSPYGSVSAAPVAHVPQNLFLRPPASCGCVGSMVRLSAPDRGDALWGYWLQQSSLVTCQHPQRVLPTQLALHSCVLPGGTGGARVRLRKPSTVAALR